MIDWGPWKADICRRCGGPREARLYPGGRCIIILRRGCPHRERCERELVPGFELERPPNESATPSATPATPSDG